MKINWNNKCFFGLTITQGRNPYHGVNIILTHYHIRCDPYLGIGRFKIKIIPCACIYCRNSMGIPWYKYLVPKCQPRHYAVKKYKYYPILGKYKDWVIIDFIEKGKYEEEY